MASALTEHALAAFVGPGLPKMTFTSAELFKPIHILPAATIAGTKRGIGLTTMNKGWLTTIPAADSGKSGPRLLDMSNPRLPKLVSSRSVTSGTNDDWQPIDLGDGYYRIVARHSVKVLNVAGVSTADGVNVDQWSWANVNQQMFQIITAP